MATSVPEPGGPVADFCAELKRLRQDSGHDLRMLARRLNISRAQLYAILNGEIKRPPDWAKVVGPLVELCTNGDIKMVAAWRRRHAVLVDVCEELYRQERLRPAPAKPGKPARKQATAACAPSDTFQASSTAAAPDQTVPRQLPAHIAHFVGRAGELAALDSLLERPDAKSHAGTVVIAAIGGTPGIGKTALALHWAHQVADRFPDGQLYVNLHGFDSAGHPVRPAEAIRRLLDTLAIPADRIPVNCDSQAALYRSLLAGKRMLIVLDNARDAAQIRPLLPGTAGCLVLVTSRNQLTGLVAAEGARLINLEALTDNEARQLLAHRIGADRIAAEQETATELIALCVRLPLALSVAAARAVTQPAYSLAAMVTALRDEHGKLDALDTGEQASSLRAVFSWSYHTLGKPAATMFRLLGLHPGPDITAPAAASMAGIPLPQARRALSDLTTAHLLAEQIPGRFAFHDLLRTYAAEQARTYDPEYQQRTAIGRVLVHYLNTAHHATTALNSGRDLLTITPPRPGVTPELFLTSGAALAWFSTERQVLSAATILASDNQFDDLAWQLCYALGSFYLGNGYWQEWASTLSAGLTSAERLGDLNAQACINLDLGRACLLPGRCDDAHKYLRHALSRCQQSGNLAIQGHAHLLLSASRMRQGDLHEALDHARQALKLYRDANHQAGQANALNNVGWFLARLGNHQEALAYSEQALAVQQEIANRDGELHTWDTLGYTLHHLGHHTKAIACYHRALNLCHELGNRHTRGEALDHLGDTYLRIGNPQAARTAWQQALEIFDDLHHPDTRQVRAKLIQHQPIGRPKSADANSRGTSG